ncbi:hypothetical protein BS78_05G078400 [Paspalum vaginatum]|nr:hypothetical protein BS78_05G078400 [Paspalum vaginatum]
MLRAIRVQFLAVLMVCCSHVPVGSFSSNYTDRQALLEFKKTISDPRQSLRSWNDSADLCRWEGVRCSVKHPHRVTSLNLTSQGLVGQISPSLGNLTFLRVLVLSANSLTGEIPPSLGHLHRLRYVNLNNNTLQGSIPSFANCSNLLVLWLENNKLVGEIPLDLPRSLKKLSLFDNNLTGIIPSYLANISTLIHLDLVGNNIEGNIPEEFTKLLELQLLYLGVNKLSGCFPQLVLNLSSLVGFDVALNSLSGDVPSNFGSALPSLQHLELGGNFFHGHIPSGLNNASKLFHIDLPSNDFSGVVPSLGKLSRLSILNLEENRIHTKSMKDWKFMKSLANCTELQQLWLGRNLLEGKVPNSLANLSSLRYLMFTENQLSGDFPSSIANLNNLIMLSLHGNQFTGVVPEWLGTLPNLQKIYLDSNGFTGVIPSSLSNMSQLAELNLDSNRFDGHIPPILGNLQMLEVLSIPDNNLEGSIPKELFKIPRLIQMNLAFNNLDGPLHSDIGIAKQLIYLQLSSNKLSGEIPNTLQNCDSLEDIELDHNVFNGSIPASLGNITSLLNMNLSHNNLTGPIPVSLSSLQLEHLDLSFNNLEGEVPTKGIFSNVTALRIDGNLGLCGGKLELHLLACAAIALNSRKHKHFTFRKFMIPLAIILPLAIIVYAVLLWKRKQKRYPISLNSFGSKFPKVSYHDLSRATEGFSESNLIGQGRYSSVYRGILFQDRTMVAVKVFNLGTKGTQKSFMAECNALKNIRHRNLVPIVTACSSIDLKGNDFMALVYQFMQQGDLNLLLYSTRDDAGTSASNNHITLAQRLCIVVNVADALEYLHHNNEGTIVHCDLKPSNILLDENMVAHVGDFGLARFIDSGASSFSGMVSTSSIAIKGTVGYVPPEYATGADVSSSGDVYSFGIILLETFLRRRPTDDMFRDGLDIASYVAMNFPDRIIQIVDPEVLEERHDSLPHTSEPMKEKIMECLLSVLNVGLRCANPSPDERMDMREVAAKLHSIKESFFSQLLESEVILSSSLMIGYCIDSEIVLVVSYSDHLVLQGV